eukprot:COSAG01_NODE_4971_length_4580_cov_12.996206_5_plen_206_part_00
MRVPAVCLGPPAQRAEIFADVQGRLPTIANDGADVSSSDEGEAPVFSSVLEPEPEPQQLQAQQHAVARRQERRRELASHRCRDPEGRAQSVPPRQPAAAATAVAAAAAAATAADAKVSAAFEAAGGYLTRAGVSALLKSLGRFEGWVESALTSICEGQLGMAAAEPEARVSAASFARWWGEEGGRLGPSEVIGRKMAVAPVAPLN